MFKAPYRHPRPRKNISVWSTNIYLYSAHLQPGDMCSPPPYCLLMNLDSVYFQAGALCPHSLDLAFPQGLSCAPRGHALWCGCLPVFRSTGPVSRFSIHSHSDWRFSLHWKRHLPVFRCSGYRPLAPHKSLALETFAPSCCWSWQPDGDMFGEMEREGKLGQLREACCGLGDPSGSITHRRLELLSWHSPSKGH